MLALCICFARLTTAQDNLSVVIVFFPNAPQLVPGFPAPTIFDNSDGDGDGGKHLLEAGTLPKKIIEYFACNTFGSI
jgi:hypothetical protein